jgi:hypothetical protein
LVLGLAAEHLAAMSGHSFRREFGGTSLARARLSGLRRNLVALQAEADLPPLAPSLLAGITEHHELARRQHQAWFPGITPETRD